MLMESKFINLCSVLSDTAMGLHTNAAFCVFLFEHVHVVVHTAYIFIGCLVISEVAFTLV